MFFAPLEFML